MKDRDNLREAYDTRDQSPLDKPDRSSPLDRPMTVVVALGVFAIVVAALLITM